MSEAEGEGRVASNPMAVGQDPDWNHSPERRKWNPQEMWNSQWNDRAPGFHRLFKRHHFQPKKCVTKCAEFVDWRRGVECLGVTGGGSLLAGGRNNG